MATKLPTSLELDDALEVEPVDVLGGPVAAGEQAHVLLLRHCCDCIGTDAGGDDDFHELALADGHRGRPVQFPVESDDAAKR